MPNSTILDNALVIIASHSKYTDLQSAHKPVSFPP